MARSAAASHARSLLSRLFPEQLDSRLAGYRSALWLLAAYVALKLVMSMNSIFNTASVAFGADGFQLDRYGAEGARAVLMLFAAAALGQLALALVALAALIRWKAMVPFAYLLLAAEHIARRLIVQSYAVAGTETAAVGAYVNYALLALLCLGLVLSLMPRERTMRP